MKYNRWGSVDETINRWGSADIPVRVRMWSAVACHREEADKNVCPPPTLLLMVARQLTRRVASSGWLLAAGQATLNEPEYVRWQRVLPAGENYAP